NMVQKTADSLLRAKEATDKLAQDASAPRRWRFILETCHLPTALRRKAALENSISVETKDSIWFNIVMNLPGRASDTARIKDSLHTWYWGDRLKKIIIEQ